MRLRRVCVLKKHICFHENHARARNDAMVVCTVGSWMTRSCVNLGRTNAHRVAQLR